MFAGYIRVYWVNSGAPFGSSGSFGFVGFVRAGRRVHSGSLSSFWHVLGWSGSFRFVGLIWLRPWGCQVHSISLGSFGRTLGVVGFIWVRSGAPWWS